jgi:hypothetical protein
MYMHHYLIKIKTCNDFYYRFLKTLSVPGAGIEPARTFVHRFLRPTRLPIPPPGLEDAKI